MRKAYIVYVDLDPLPGIMHSQESAQNVIRNVLYQRMPKYNPIVSLAPNEFQSDPASGLQHNTEGNPEA